MLKEFVEKINALNDHETIELNGKKFIKKGYETVTEPIPMSIQVISLEGFCEFVNNFKGEFDIITVDSEREVSLRGPINDDGMRACFCKAVIDWNMPNFDQWRTPEDFNIFIRSNFVPTEDQNTLVDIIGQLKVESSAEWKDDGFAQEVVSKTGNVPTKKTVPNPATLKPYRTFPEIEQPESIFIVRMKINPVEIRIFTADGNQWKVKAISNIKTFLSENIEREVKIIG